MVISLWPAQQKVFDWAKDREASALLMDTRTGKTFVSLKLIEHCMSTDDEFVGLLVCLLNNKESTWVKHSSDHLPELQVFTDLDEFKGTSGHRLLLVHFEELPKVIDKLVKYKKLNWACVDEAHRANNPGSKQSRAIARLHWVPRRIILTATPMEKKPTDFFGQFKFLDPSVLGTNKSKFEDEWLEWKKLDFDQFVGMKKGGPAWQQKMMQQRILKSKAKFKEERLGEFVALLEPYCIRVDKVDVGIIPPEVISHKMKFGGAHMARYDAMKKEAVLQIGDTEILAQLPATRVMKLRQLACGFVYDEEGELHWLSSKKIREAIDLFESLPKPVVIFSAFIPEVIRLHTELEKRGYDVGLVYGKTRKRDRPGLWAQFQRGELDAIVCQIGAGGVGVDLWKANNGIITSLPYSSIIVDQAKARMDSRDKQQAARIFVLIAEKSIDEDLLDLVLMKGQTTKQVLKHLRGRVNTWQKRKKPRSTRSRTCRTTSANRRQKSG